MMHSIPGTRGRSRRIARASTWKPFSYWTRPHVNTSGVRPPGDSPVDHHVGSMPLGIRWVRSAGSSKPSIDLADHELRAGEHLGGVVGEPRLDGVDRARLARRHPAAVLAPLGGVERGDELGVVERRPACRPPRRPASRGRGRCRAASRRAGSTSCTRWWLAEATRATSSSSGSHGRSVRARSTRTPPTMLSAGAPGWASVSSTTSWPAARERLAEPVDVGGDATDRAGRELPGQHQDPHRRAP